MNYGQSFQSTIASSALLSQPVSHASSMLIDVNPTINLNQQMNVSNQFNIEPVTGSLHFSQLMHQTQYFNQHINNYIQEYQFYKVLPPAATERGYHRRLYKSQENLPQPQTDRPTTKSTYIHLKSVESKKQALPDIKQRPAVTDGPLPPPKALHNIKQDMFYVPSGSLQKVIKRQPEVTARPPEPRHEELTQRSRPSERTERPSEGPDRRPKLESVSRPEIVIDRSEIRPRGSQRKITITSPTQPSPELIQDRLAQLIHKQKNMLLEIAERNKKNNHEIRKIDNQNHKITGIFTEVIKKNITPQKKGVQLFVEPEEVEQPKPVSPVRQESKSDLFTERPAQKKQSILMRLASMDPSLAEANVDCVAELFPEIPEKDYPSVTCQYNAPRPRLPIKYPRFKHRPPLTSRNSASDKTMK